ncbi:MAG TPA: 2-amino-4-hydroxy-6-hydroxymethyldihydropteridine diphosphokinase [Actinomycetota bacterium]|nr:2-amino-4-hydroxy-6-hydroxymethyldihydropteridine diphosphokinase [Actinomycetota bacterium]
MTIAYLGLGSNLGDRLEHLRRAVGLLRERGVRVLRSSRVYETEPVGGPDQPDYLNAVLEVDTDGTARELLEVCLAAEAALGRERAERWGPRVIDVDLLTFDQETIYQPDLQVPHPRMHERAFVLIPLLELDPDPRLPGGRRAGDLRLEGLGRVRLHAPPLAT